MLLIKRKYFLIVLNYTKENFPVLTGCLFKKLWVKMKKLISFFNKYKQAVQKNYFNLKYILSLSSYDNS